MQYQWLQHGTDSNEVIVFFSGWGFNAKLVQHLHSDCDVLFVHDYRNLDNPLPCLARYQTRIVIAWSFGVAAFAQWQQKYTFLFDCAIAINGSVTAVDRKIGIPLKVMQTTIDTLSPVTYRRFRIKSLGENQSEQAEYPITEHELEALRQELHAIAQWQSTPSTMQWDAIWLSQQDAIFPIRNLTRAWQNQATEIRSINAPHAPFTEWKSWREIFILSYNFCNDE